MSAARVILAGILLAQLADATTFAVAITRFGIGLESNPFAVILYRVAGLEAILLAKLAVIVSALLLIALTASRYPRLLIWGGAAATSLGLMGFASNTASMLILG